MTPLISTRRVEEFANAADGRTAARRGDVRALVELVEAVRAVESPTPRSDFVAELRASLVASAHTELSSALALVRPAQRRVVPAPTPLGRRLAVAASALVVAGGGVGLVATSASALPGTILYPVKRATERVDLLLHTDPRDDARILLGHADTRLDEVDGLLAAGAPTPDTNRLFRQTLGDFADEATRGGAILLDSYQQTGSTADIEYLRSFTTAAADRLEQLAPSLPPSSSQAFADAAAALGALDEQAVTLCPACRAGEPAVDTLSQTIGEAEQLLGTPPLIRRQDTDAGSGGGAGTNGPGGGAGTNGPGDGDRGDTDLEPQPQPDPPQDVVSPPTDLPKVDTDPSAPPDATSGPQPPEVTPTGTSPLEAVEDLLTGDGDAGDSDGGTGGGSDSDSTEPSPDPSDILDTPLPLAPLTDPLAD